MGGVVFKGNTVEKQQSSATCLPGVSMTETPSICSDEQVNLGLSIYPGNIQPGFCVSSSESLKMTRVPGCNGWLKHCAGLPSLFFCPAGDPLEIHERTTWLLSFPSEANHPNYLDPQWTLFSAFAPVFVCRLDKYRDRSCAKHPVQV